MRFLSKFLVENFTTFLLKSTQHKFYTHKVPNARSVSDLVDKLSKFNIIDEIVPTQPEKVRTCLVSYHNKELRHKLSIIETLNSFTSHINEKGFIRSEVLELRKEFLNQESMLENEINHLGRQVFANRHLYDFEQKNANEQLNWQRMLSGYPPLDKAGQELIVIHHFDQTHIGPWVVLTNQFHKENDKILHTNISLIHGVKRNKFNLEKKAFWRAEALLYMQIKQGLKFKAN